MSLNNGFITKQELIILVLDIYDSLNHVDRNAYNIGMEVGKIKGKEFRRIAQGARILISSYISDLLVEILNPLILEDSKFYPELRKRHLGDFLSGIVKATQ